ncbi:APC family permease [Stutzerimonas azotifigens]|uniref:APC family permease n=1 Tax=Stutzerimonas azotifigens TaxID=291995 RepID=UPI00041EA8DC|nr:APC family permease [Stutzerimonas azotifigens]
MDARTRSRPGLSVVDGVAVLVGVVVGVGIFGFPPLIAQHADSHLVYLGLWLAGGLLMLAGALCYAELGAAFPHEGGEYHYLHRAWGARLALLFAWARGTVIQTGAIAAVAFIYAEYAQRLLPLGAQGAALHAALAVVLLTALNMVGTPESKRLQLLLSTVTVLGVLGMAVAGLGADAAAEVAPAGQGPGLSPGLLGMGLVFVLLTYGGWNEAAYLSGELREPSRSMSRVLLYGTLLVMALYLLANLAFLHVFGLDGLRQADAVGAELMRRVAGPPGEALLGGLICITALSTLNATILTGARVYYALGRDVPQLAMLGTWNDRGATPVRALLVQGAITLLLVLFGAVSENAVQSMVAYTAPVFWLFMLLTVLALLRLRRTLPQQPRPFRVPLYPWLPLLFALVCLGLFWSSTLYAGAGALVGLLVLLLGLPLLWLRRAPLAAPRD